MPLLVILIYSIVQLIRYGDVSNYSILLIGSILSIGAIVGYIINELVNGIQRNKSFLAMFLAFGGFIPWLFGIYLVFVPGIWSLKDLSSNNLLVVITKSFGFVVLGYLIVFYFYKITEIAKETISKLEIENEFTSEQTQEINEKLKTVLTSIDQEIKTYIESRNDNEIRQFFLNGKKEDVERFIHRDTFTQEEQEYLSKLRN